jgi:hypothetical protein
VGLPLTIQSRTAHIRPAADAAPDAADWAHAIRVIDACDLPGGGPVILNANPLEKQAVCYVQSQTIRRGKRGPSG